MHLPDLCINTTAILHFLSSTLHSILELTAITVQTAPADQANFVSVALDPLWEKEPPFQTLLGQKPETQVLYFYVYLFPQMSGPGRFPVLSQIKPQFL